MSKRIDMQGLRCGRLWVIKYVGNAKWECLCDCGNTAFVRGADLRDKSTRSCGCLVKDVSRKNMITMMGKGESSRNYIKNRRIAAFNQVIATYKSGAKARGLEYSLEQDFAIGLLEENCFYCGKPPSNSKRVKVTKDLILYSGIDRVDNNIGYIKDNVVSCCRMCNRAKNDMGMGEFLRWIQSVFYYRIVEKKS